MVKGSLTHSGTVPPLARKHAAKLRNVAAGSSFGLPLALSGPSRYAGGEAAPTALAESTETAQFDSRDAAA